MSEFALCHCTRPSNRRLRAILLGVAVGAASPACAGLEGGVATVNVRTDPGSPFADRCGAEWFGIYIDGQKVGFSTTLTTVEQGARGLVLRRRSRLLMETGGAGGTVVTRSASSEDYALVEPLELLWRREERQQGAGLVGCELTRVEGGLEVRRLDAARPQGRISGSYGLRDVFSEDRWIQSGPSTGARHRRAVLDTDGLSLASTRATLREVIAPQPGGAPQYELERRAGDGTIELERRSADGRILRWSLGALELRREPVDVARGPRAAVDLAALGTAPLDRPLGAAESVREMTLVAEGPGSGGLASTATQSVEPLAGDRVRVRVRVAPRRGTSGFEGPRDPRADEGGPHSRATLRFPAADPELRALAATAVGTASSVEDRIAALCTFVADFIDDDLVDADHATVAEVVRLRRGDCSDHVLLFVTLARALGIPARPVTGLLYLGDDALAFGAHDWCEVAVAGRWVEVDPTWNQFPASAARLRLGSDQLQGIVTAQFRLRLEGVVHAP